MKRLLPPGILARIVTQLGVWPLALTACACLTGCFGFLKPTPSVERHFVLTTLPAPELTSGGGGGLAVGVGRVKIANYLFETCLATRKGTNEIYYLRSVLWAERLDSGLQRVLAANLSTLLATDRVRLSTWRREDVTTEVQIFVEQLDVDTNGHGVLVAWWRILSPGGEKILKSDVCRLAREGSPPESDPSGSIATLSDLVADLSRKLAETIQQTAQGSLFDPVR